MNLVLTAPSRGVTNFGSLDRCLRVSFRRDACQLHLVLLRAPREHTESLLMRVFSKKCFHTRAISLANRIDDGMVTTVGTKQEIECAPVSDLIKDNNRRSDEGHEIQPIDKHGQHRGITRNYNKFMKLLVHGAVLLFIFAIKVSFVE